METSNPTVSQISPNFTCVWYITYHHQLKKTVICPTTTLYPKKNAKTKAAYFSMLYYYEYFLYVPFRVINPVAQAFP
jgi:hypothetical protein